MFGIGVRVWNKTHGFGTITWVIQGLNEWYTVEFDCGVTRNLKYTRLKFDWEV